MFVVLVTNSVSAPGSVPQATESGPWQLGDAIAGWVRLVWLIQRYFVTLYQVNNLVSIWLRWLGTAGRHFQVANHSASGWGVFDNPITDPYNSFSLLRNSAWDRVAFVCRQARIRRCGVPSLVAGGTFPYIDLVIAGKSPTYNTDITVAGISSLISQPEGI